MWIESGKKITWSVLQYRLKNDYGGKRDYSLNFKSSVLNILRIRTVIVYPRKPSIKIKRWWRKRINTISSDWYFDFQWDEEQKKTPSEAWGDEWSR